MQHFHPLSLIEQVAAYLRGGLSEGRWRGQLPGLLRLAAELGVAKNTLVAAMRLLESEGLIALSADGRSRCIVTKATKRKRPLRIGILLLDVLENSAQVNQLFVQVHHALDKAGLSPFFATETLDSLREDVRRIGRYTKTTHADAWVVAFGTREVLTWFATQKFPSLAIFGRRSGVPIASVGPDKGPAYSEVTRRLIRLGHRRIVLLSARLRRLPEPGRLEQAFLAELAAHGIQTSSFNLPDWEVSAAGYHAMLSSLFRVTPPTALIIDEVPLFAAAQQFLAGCNLRVPEHVSLVATDNDASFLWCHPPVTHIHWSYTPVIRRVVEWANNVSRGRTDRQQTLFPAAFVPGGTIGPAWKGKL
jgi:DNA-binding LacI/PurR family transcriptional regulator